MVTPNFQSPNTSRSASPHSVTPYHGPREEQKKGHKNGSELSFVSVEKKEKEEKEEEIRLPVLTQLREMQLMEESMDLALLTGRLTLLLAPALGCPNLTPFFTHFYELVFELLLPMLILHDCRELAVSWLQSLPISQLMAPSKQVRSSLVYMVFLLCMLTEDP